MLFSLKLTLKILYMPSMTALIILISFFKADAIDYKDYKRSSNQSAFFEISVDVDQITVTSLEEPRHSETFLRKEIIRNDKEISIGSTVLFLEEGIEFFGSNFKYKDISSIKISRDEDADEQNVTITFFKGQQESRSRRVRLGNLITYNEDIVVGEDDFVRGVVFSVNGDIEIYGEVNRDVVSLFGDVYIGPGAVARGDVATLTSRIDVARNASIYGEVLSGKKQRIRRYHRFYRGSNEISLTSRFRYNRVDGAATYLGLRYNDVDSLLPTLWAEGGYGFASDRWRYEFGAEQTLWRQRSLLIGGSIYRRLASEDDWLLTDNENLIFTLLATEDFKNYYEAEGGTAWLKFRPWHSVEVESRYRYDDTRWLESHRHLWSLFGGNKLFSENFSQVEPSFRTESISKINTTVNGAFSLKLSFDSRSGSNPFRSSGWYAVADYELSHPDLRSDFDYSRYLVRASRYQKVHRRSTLIFTGMYGGSEGDLPMYKRFYLGGLGTLRGYSHQEYMGNDFWMARAEYYVRMTHGLSAISLFWEGGQIASGRKLSEGSEVKQDIGLGVFLYDYIKLYVSKRLDSSNNDDPKFYVRFSHQF